jgi:hypothetical protein
MKRFIAENVLPHSGRAAFRLRHFSTFYFPLDTPSAKLNSFHDPKVSWSINLSQKGAMSDGNRQRLSGSAFTWHCRLWLFVHYIITVSVVTLSCLCCIVYELFTFRNVLFPSFSKHKTNKCISYSFFRVILIGRLLVHTTYENGTDRVFRNVGT